MIIKESRRSCFYFGEEILLRLAMFNWTPENQKDSTMSFKLDGKEIERRELPVVGTHSDNIIIFTGGDSFYFAHRIKHTVFATQDMVLQGLAIIADFYAK